MAGSPPVNFGIRNVHQNIPLTNMSIGYHPTGLIADSVFAIMKVLHENDTYYKWDKGQAFRLERSDGFGSLRPDKSRPKMLNFGATLDSYIAEEFALETGISDRERANQDSSLMLEMAKTRRLQDLVLLDLEIRIANICINTANNSGSVTNSGTSQWNNASFASQTNGQHSVIKAQIETGKESVRFATGGLLPNVIVLPREVASVMYNDVGLADLVKYNSNNPQGSLLGDDFLPPSLWGMKVLIPSAIANNTVEGEVYSGTSVWGKNVWMGYVNPNPGLDALTYGLQLRSREWQVKQYRDEFTDTVIYRPSIVQAEKLVASDCGYLIKNAIA